MEDVRGDVGSMMRENHFDFEKRGCGELAERISIYTK